MTYRTPERPPNIKPIPSGISRPVWSVMIPTFNCFGYIKEAIESVLEQDPGEELMQIQVVDDCSTDGDVEELVKQIGKGRVLFFSQEINQGSLRNFETCLNLSKGERIHLLHGDDRVKMGFYEEINYLFQNYPETDAAFTNFMYIDGRSRVANIKNAPLLTKPGTIPDFLFLISSYQRIQPPCIVVKRSVYESIGSFFAVHFGEDWEMWTRIAAKYQFAYSPKYLAQYRVGHGIGISHDCFLHGENISEIKKVIEIIQNYLPLEKRKKYKNYASAYYALYCIKVANSLLLKNKKAAFFQIKGAWDLSKGFKTSFWIIRFYLMYILRFKQIENKLRSKEKKENVHEIFT
jgi:glycosyltransferase involved in cell wall biosynthesis